MATEGIKLIVGLGNPGPSYADTRHNVGAWFVEAFCKQNRIQLKNDAKFNARLGQFSGGGRDVKVFISNTYMNHSGRAVSSIAKYFQIPHEAILVAHDELDLPPGVVRFKTGGGHGGHNGLRDIIHHLKTRDFHRLRLGIGHPGHKDEVVDYVLQKPSQSDEKKIREAIDEAIAILPQIIAGDFEKVMNSLHTAKNL